MHTNDGLALADARPVSAPETRAAGPRNNDPITALTDEVRSQTRAITKAVADRRAAATAAPQQRASRAAALRARVEAIRPTNARRLQALRDSAAEQEPLARRGRADPLIVERNRRINADIDATNDADRREMRRIQAENRELRTRLARPHGPTSTVPGLPSGQKSLMAAYRKATLEYMRTGRDTFNGVHLRDLEKRAMQGQSNPDGGFLLHPEYDTGPLEKLLYQYVPMREIATVQNISAGSLKKPFNKRGRGAKWVGEVDTRPTTATSQFAELEFTAMELYAEPSVTQSMLEDSFIDLEAYIAEEVAEDFGITEAEAFIAGTGIKQPRGLLAYPKLPWTANFDYSANMGSTPYIPTGTDALFNATAPADALMQMPYKLKGAYRQGASYMLNRGTIGVARTLKDSGGRYLWSEGVYVGQTTGAQPPTLGGYPVNEVEQMPDMASNSFSVAFGDFKRTYIIVDRLGMTLLRDPYSAKPNVVFYTRKRVGGGIKNFEAMVLLKFAVS